MVPSKIDSCFLFSLLTSYLFCLFDYLHLWAAETEMVEIVLLSLSLVLSLSDCVCSGIVWWISIGALFGGIPSFKLSCCCCICSAEALEFPLFAFLFCTCWRCMAWASWNWLVTLIVSADWSASCCCCCSCTCLSVWNCSWIMSFCDSWKMSALHFVLSWIIPSISTVCAAETAPCAANAAARCCIKSKYALSTAILMAWSGCSKCVYGGSFLLLCLKIGVVFRCRCC